VGGGGREGPSGLVLAVVGVPVPLQCSVQVIPRLLMSVPFSS
jgi:hypothetical protein